MLWRTLAAFVVLFFFSGARSTWAADQRPNVIVFIADDVSWNDYGCYGNSAARTPNIDALAEAGIRFDRAYLTASSCSPSRSSIITGRYPHNNGAGAELHQPISGHIPWFPEVLRDAGYYTALSGKHHMKSTNERPKAFDHIDGGRIASNSGGHANWVSVTKNRPRDKPFFFWFASYDAHRGWDADRQWQENQYGPEHKSQDVVVPPFLVDDSATRTDLASYYNEVTRFDFYIGQVITELKKQGVWNNTLVFVLADNGRPFPRAKTRLHDSGMKTALVAHWSDGISEPGPSASLVSVIDLAPTILSVAGAEPLVSMQGVTLQPVFDNPEASVRQYAFSEHNWHDYEAHGRSVRMGDYLLLKNFRPNLAWQGPADSVRSPSHDSLKSRRSDGTLTSAQRDVFQVPRPALELYNLKTDPFQLRNIANDADARSTREKLSAVLDQWMDETGDSVPEIISGDTFDRETGKRLKEKPPQGVTPGQDRKADLINHPGPR